MIENDITIMHCCPACGESYYTENYCTCTTLYYPPIYKDGVITNLGKNKTAHHCTCMNCGHEFGFEE